MTQALHGVWAAALTPMTADGAIDFERLHRHYRWLLTNGCEGIAALGTTGEANSFTVAERRRLIESLVDAGLPMQRIMLGTGCCALGDTVELTQAALAANAAATLMLPPFYYKGVSDDGLFACYARVIEQVGDSRLRIVVYDFPRMTGLELSVDLLVRLNQAFPEVVVGVKDSSGNWPDMAETCRRLPGFATFAGTEQYLLATLQAGGAGCISATANVTAPLCAKVHAAWRRPEAVALQEALTRQRLAIQKYPLIAAGKEIMARHTGHAGWRQARPPQTPLPPDKAESLWRELAQVSFQLPAAA
ncbi:MAG: dihydrodipicolinate synthase family protein [Alphaproteobacteria bacterium]|nr:dihydrodipicolinate synthase family protein [Alphaproteobacteria bacterium]